MNTKYEFTGETKIVYGRTLHRIKAIVAIGATVAPGDIGGWIESENNLSVYGNAEVSGNAKSKCFFCNKRGVYVYDRKSVISPYCHYSKFNCAADCETREVVK